MSGVTYANVPYGEHEFQVRAVEPGRHRRRDAGHARVGERPHDGAGRRDPHRPGRADHRHRPRSFTFRADDPAAHVPVLARRRHRRCRAARPRPTRTCCRVPTTRSRSCRPSRTCSSTPSRCSGSGRSATWPRLRPRSTPARPPPPSPRTPRSRSRRPTTRRSRPSRTSARSTAPPFSSCDSPVELSGLELGEHTLAVRASDVSGNADATPATHTWTVADATTIDSGPAALSDSADATFTFSAFAAGVPFQCSLDGEPFASCSSPLALTRPGRRRPRARGPGRHRRAERVGRDARVLRVDDRDPGRARHDDRRRAGRGHGRDDRDCSSSPPARPDVDVRVLARRRRLRPVRLGRSSTPPSTGGLHRFEVRAVDAGGSADALAGGPRVDRRPGAGDHDPLRPAGVDREYRRAQFEFASNEPDATFECSLDGGASWGSCDASTQYTDVAVGDHELLVRAEDALRQRRRRRPPCTAGPCGRCPRRRSTRAPTRRPRAAARPSRSPPTRPGATFECRLDDAATFTPCASPRTYTDLAVEEHDLLVRALDADGNPDPTPAEYELGDRRGPAARHDRPRARRRRPRARARRSRSRRPSPALTYECSLDGAAFSQCASPKTYSGLPLGEHTLRVQVFSPTSIVEQVPDTHTWTVVDLTAPATTIELAPAAVTGSATATFAFSSEAGATFECSLDGGGYAPCDSPAPAHRPGARRPRPRGARRRRRRQRRRRRRRGTSGPSWRRPTHARPRPGARARRDER